MSHHEEGRHAASLAVSNTNPKTVRLKDSFEKNEPEKSAVAKKLRKAKGKAVGASVAHRKVSKQKKCQKGCQEPP